MQKKKSPDFRRPEVGISEIISHGHVRLSSSFKDFVARYSLLVFFSSLAFRF